MSWKDRKIIAISPESNKKVEWLIQSRMKKTKKYISKKDMVDEIITKYYASKTLKRAVDN